MIVYFPHSIKLRGYKNLITIDFNKFKPLNNQLFYGLF